MLRYVRSSRPLEHRARASRASQVAAGAEDLHQQPERLEVELGAEHLDRRRVGRVSSGALRRARHATFQLTSRRNSSLACTRARLSCTHSWSITRRPSAQLRRPAAHSTHVVELPLDHAATSTA